MIESLVAYLRDRHLLLVVDNCEHLLQGCAAITTRIVDEATSVSLLLTSRQALDTGDNLLMVGETTAEIYIPERGVPAP